MQTDTIATVAKRLLDMDEGELKPHERLVIERCVRRLAVSRNVNLQLDEQATFGQRVADQVAAVGGSWAFIIGFGLVILAWVVLNSVILATRAFDPYPYILLNLMLSMLASIQAPVILMSQNRSAARDRLMATHDYEVNLKAEIEIAALHDKLDQLRTQDLAQMIQRLEAAVLNSARR